MIFRSPFPDISIPEVAFTPFILQNARARGSKPALVDASTGFVITYEELPAWIARAASKLMQRGVGKGTVVGIYSPNCPAYAVAFHAACFLGAITTTVNPLYTVTELRNQLKDAHAPYLILPESLRDKAADVNEAKVITFEELLKDSRGDERLPPVEIDPRQDLAALPYSSGTTGFPKGVMLTHRNLVSNVLQVHGSELQDSDDVLLCVLPMFHIYGLVVILNVGLYIGSTIITMPRFELEKYLQNIQKYRVTFAHVVPPMVLALSQNPAVDRYDLSTLRRIFCAAAPLSPALLQDCMKRLRCLVKQGYGMTEASPATHMCPDEESQIKHGSVGVCVSNTECRVVDVATGRELNANQEGEICIRGPQIMQGYLNCPDATAIAIDSEGWLRSGDIGYADEDGHFYIVDRLKELIKYKGFQVAPAELEAVILLHPAVADAAVVPMADAEAGEVPKAFVVRKAEASELEILAFVAERVAPYKKIRKVEFVEQIPRSPSGKILRRLLKEK